MKPTFQADNDLRRVIVDGVLRRHPAIDFQLAQTAVLDGMPDADVLALCSRERRILISHDFDTMPVHFRRFVQTSWSPGVLLLRQQGSIRVAIESLLLIWETTEAAEWENRLCVLPSLYTLAVGFAPRPTP